MNSPPKPKLPRCEEPWISWDKYGFFKHVRFFPDAFDEIVSALSLVPDSIVIGTGRDKYHRHSVPKKLAVFILLFRWTQSTYREMEEKLGYVTLTSLFILLCVQSMVLSLYMLCCAHVDWFIERVLIALAWPLAFLNVQDQPE